MRVVSGVVALVLGLAAIFGAVGLQTIWAQPATLTATNASSAVDAPAEAPLTVITGGINEAGNGTADDAVDYTLTGEGDYTVMLGQTRDIEAWVGDAAHNTVTGVETDVPDGQSPRVTVEHTEGETKVPNPAGSDLWVDVQEASGTIDQRWSVPSEGDWALLVAADDTAPAPTEMTVTWTNTLGDSPWIVPLAIIGALLVLVGLGLLGWAFVRRHRANRAPKDTGGHDGGAGTAPHHAVPPRPSQSPRSPGTPGSGPTGSGSTQARVAGAVVGVLALAGVFAAGPATADGSTTAPAPDASATEAPTAEAPAEGDDDRYPIVTDSQLERILGKVSMAVRRGDRDQDADAIRPRVRSQAYLMRSYNYRNQRLSDEVREPEPVAASPVLSVVAEADPAFPRTLAVVTEGEGNSTPQFLVLRQESAREQYKLVMNTPMTPGAQLPASDLSNTEVETIASDDKTGLVTKPGLAVAGLARYLTDPETDFADQMVKNPTIDAIHEYQASIEQDAPDATMSIARGSVPDASMALRLPDGSALVIGAIDARMTIAPRTSGDVVVVDDLAAARAGEDSNESTNPVRMTYREIVAVHVPADSATGEDAKVSLVGMTDELQNVTFD